MQYLMLQVDSSQIRPSLTQLRAQCTAGLSLLLRPFGFTLIVPPRVSHPNQTNITPMKARDIMSQIDVPILREWLRAHNAEAFRSWLEQPRAWIVLLAAAGLLLAVVTQVVAAIGRRKLRLKHIVLSDETSSPKARALQYCYRPREVMLKGYKQFRDTVYGMDTRDGKLNGLESHGLSRTDS